MKKLLGLIFIVVGCGQQEQAPVGFAAQVEPTAATTTSQQTSLYLKSKAELPVCQLETEGTLAYVVEQEEFVTCTETQWKTVSIKSKDGAPGKDGKDGEKGIDGSPGRDGAPGKDGTNGINGAPGANGRDGIDGTNGVNGTNGANGQAGVNGVDGVDGVDGANGLDGILGLPQVIDQDENLIGYLASFSVTDSAQHYSVVVGQKRVSINISTGQLRSLYTVYSGLNCTGTTYSVVENGWYENTGIEGETGRILSRTGRVLANVSYQSRRAFGANCANTAGSVLRSTTAIETTLPFSLPIMGVQLKNW
jgi:hypothetical protein